MNDIQKAHHQEMLEAQFEQDMERLRKDWDEMNERHRRRDRVFDRLMLVMLATASVAFWLPVVVWLWRRLQ